MKNMLNVEAKYMKAALKEAEKAYAKGEVPVGCVLVLNGKIIARAHNQRQNTKSIFDHAEIIAIKKANKKLHAWILEDVEMYVTLEPCLMCAGAILQSRLKRVVFGAREPKFGVIVSTMEVFDNEKFNHHIEVVPDFFGRESSDLMKKFFQELRNNSKK